MAYCISAPLYNSVNLEPAPSTQAAAFFKKALIRKHIKTSSTSSNNTNNINENFSKNAYGSSSSATSPISNKSGTLSPSAKFNF